MRLGPLDVKILRALQADARRSFRDLADELGSTTPTISARVKALEDIGLLRGYRAQLDTSILGGASYVLTFIVHPPQARAALASVAALPGTQRVQLLPGGRLVALIHLRPPASTLAELHEQVAQVPGLQTYEAGEVLSTQENAPADDLPESVDVPCHQCRGPIHGEPVKGRFNDRTHVFCCRQCLTEFRRRFEALAAAATTKAPPARGRKGVPRTDHRH